jgi:Peptidase family M28
VKDWELTFTSAGKTYAFPSARPSMNVEATPAAGRDFEVVWVGMGSEADYLGRDVKGKAVIVQDILTPGVLNHSINYDQSVQRAYDHGAAAVGIVYGVADNFAVWEGTRGRPGFQIGWEDGKALRDLLGQGRPVTVKYRVDSEMQRGLKSASVWGSLKGATDEDILVVAHMDAYFEGAIDNGSGLAVMMGLAEHYAKIPQAQRRRSIRFLGSVGHHAGPGTRWLHDNRETELSKTALIINLEHVAAVRTKYWGPHLRMSNAVAPMRWWVYGSPKLLSLAVDAFKHFNVGLTADMDPNASGEIGAIERDAPSMQVITSPEVKHTEQDSPEWVPAVGLEQIARAYARIIDDVNKLNRPDLLPAVRPDSTAANRR